MTPSSHDDPATMADLLEYLYGDESTAFGKQRIADGHEEPFKVKYFELGEWC